MVSGFLGCARNDKNTVEALLLCLFERSREVSFLMQTRTYYIYIMASESGTLYVRMTNNLLRRVMEHKKKENKGVYTKIWV